MTFLDLFNLSDDVDILNVSLLIYCMFPRLATFDFRSA